MTASTLRLETIIHAVTGIGIMIGLALVIWELRQAKILARVEVGEEIAALEVAKDLAMLGERWPDVFVKGCLHPERLTDEEYAVEVAALNVEYNIALRIRYAEAVGRFDLPWQDLARVNLGRMLARPVGRERFELLGRASRWDDELEALGRAMLANGEVTPCAETIGVGRPTPGDQP